LKKILINGLNGQLGKCLQRQAKDFTDFKFIFLSSQDWDITNNDQTQIVFDEYQPDILINTAAYTNVDDAEKEREKAFSVNADALAKIAHQCNQYQTFLIHISTDYVFAGTKSTAYKETDFCDPINTYGQSKRLGEQIVEQNARHAAIIRTSWLYSSFGKNFLTTMLALGKKGVDLKIVNNQFGAPTNANDLAYFLLLLAQRPSDDVQHFHFCNSGKTNWHDFAKLIFQTAGIKDQVNLSPTDHYPTKAQRPQYSLLDSSKLSMYLKKEIPHWQNSLEYWYKKDEDEGLI